MSVGWRDVRPDFSAPVGLRHCERCLAVKFVKRSALLVVFSNFGCVVLKLDEIVVTLQILKLGVDAHVSHLRLDFAHVSELSDRNQNLLRVVSNFFVHYLYPIYFFLILNGQRQ